MKYDTLSTGQRKQHRKDAEIWQDLANRAQAAYQAGDEDGAADLYGELVTRSRPWLLSIARGELRSELVSEWDEEMVQITHLHLWKLITSSTVIEKGKGLLGTIIRRRIIDLHRKFPEEDAEDEEKKEENNKFWDPHAASEKSRDEDPARIVEKRETTSAMHSIINSVLDALTESEREIVEARCIRGLTVAECIAELGLSKDQITHRLQTVLEHIEQISLERGYVE